MKRIKYYYYFVISIFLFSCTIENDGEITNSHQSQFDLTSTEVNQIASNFSKDYVLEAYFNQKGDKLGKNSKTKSDLDNFSNKTVKSIESLKNKDSKSYLHIINYEGGGYLILSADKRAMPVLAYSLTNNFTVSDKYPEGLSYWLELASSQIEEIRNKNISSTKDIDSLWKTLLSNEKTKNTLNAKIIDPFDPCDPPEDEQVGPLMSTTWDQLNGFNASMPYLACGPDNRAWSGCVMVAFAQVMKYHEYPTSYSWSSMPNTTSSTQTADLIRDIYNTIPYGNTGVECFCNVTSVEGGYDFKSILTSGFSYTSASQGSYNYSTVQQNIRDGKPVILAGSASNNTGGHMWVCDGFKTFSICVYDDFGDYITTNTYLQLHMNWGWNGANNGFYFFDNFNPGTSNFNYNQVMIYNITP